MTNGNDKYEYSCPECNAIIGADDKICPKCGEKFEEIQHENIPLYKENPVFFKILIIVGIFVSLKSQLLMPIGEKNFVYYILGAIGSFTGLVLVSYLLGYIPVQLLQKKVKKARVITYGIIFLFVSIGWLTERTKGVMDVSLSERHIERVFISALFLSTAIAAFEKGIWRFGKPVKVPLFAIFTFSWISSTLISIFWQSIERGIGIVIVSMLIIGILFWLSSLAFGNKKKKHSA